MRNSSDIYERFRKGRAELAASAKSTKVMHASRWDGLMDWARRSHDHIITWNPHFKMHLRWRSAKSITATKKQQRNDRSIPRARESFSAERVTLGLHSQTL